MLRMTETEIERVILELAKTQDSLMHSTSAELGVKTSLYLVFSVFLVNAAFQIGSFARGIESPWSSRAVVTGFFGAATALLAGIALLVAALVRTYHVVPIGRLRQYVKDIADYKHEYPDASEANVVEGIIETIEDTVG